MAKAQKKQLRFTHVRLENWRNFTEVDVPLQRRVFLVGPNASGKSNFLDVFRFLGDIAVDKGDFLAAMGKPWRGGIKLKSLMARQHADVGIHVCVGDDESPRQWEYELRFAQDRYSLKIASERILRQGKEIVRRPNAEDETEAHRLTQSYLEQTGFNQKFRELVEFFASIRYSHFLPQILRNLAMSTTADDPFGGKLLREMVSLPENTRRQRFAIIRDALRAAVPQLQELEIWTDPVAKVPHLRARYQHLPGTWQLEDQLSDGTLRLISMVWALLEGSGPLLLEEPELLLHPGVVRYLPSLLATIQGRNGKQVMISTHSPDLIREEGIGLNEVLIFQPTPEGSIVQLARDLEQVKVLVDSGVSLDEAVMPLTSAPEAAGLAIVDHER